MQYASTLNGLSNLKVPGRDALELQLATTAAICIQGAKAPTCQHGNPHHNDWSLQVSLCNVVQMHFAMNVHDTAPSTTGHNS